MPLILDSRSVSRIGDDRALHVQLAEAIRAQIDDGSLRPGEPLPPEGDIGASLAISRAPVRQAMDLLAAEGLIVKRSGSPARVATPPPVRIMSTERYATQLVRLIVEGAEEHPQTSAFVTDHGITWEEYAVQADYVERPASDDEARRLKIAVGETVLRRHLVKWAGGVPVQIQVSVIPLALVAGTPVTDPERQPWPGGTIAELFSVDLVVTRVAEELRSRLPSPDERRILELPATAPVFEIVRTFCTEDGPVEMSVAVAQGGRTVLTYETDLSEVVAKARAEAAASTSSAAR